MTEVSLVKGKEIKVKGQLQLDPSAPTFVPSSNNNVPKQSDLVKDEVGSVKKVFKYGVNKSSEPPSVNDGGSKLAEVGSSNRNQTQVYLGKRVSFQSCERKKMGFFETSVDFESSSTAKDKQMVGTRDLESQTKRTYRQAQKRRATKKPVASSNQTLPDKVKPSTSNPNPDQVKPNLIETNLSTTSLSQSTSTSTSTSKNKNKPVPNTSKDKPNPTNFNQNSLTSSKETYRGKSASRILSTELKEVSFKKVSSRTLGPRLLVKGLHHLSNSFEVFHQTIADNSAFLKVGLKPTGPDFPYPLERLQLQFKLTSKGEYRYPHDLKVINPELPRNFAVNVEAALSRRCNQEGSRSTLVANLEWLDANLAAILAQPEASIIKFVRRAPAVGSNVTSQPEETGTLFTSSGSKEHENPPENPPENSLSSSSHLNPVDFPQSSSTSNKQYSEPKTSTTSIRRQKEITQLKNRFRSAFKETFSSKDFTQVQMVLEPNDPEFTLLAYCSSFILNLTVPGNYPELPVESKVSLSSPTTKINEAMVDNLSRGFNNYAQQATDKTIFHCINWLSCHVESLLNCNSKHQVVSNKLRLHARPFNPVNPTNKEVIPETASDINQRSTKYLDYRTVRSEHSGTDNLTAQVSEEEILVSSDSDPGSGSDSEPEGASVHNIPLKTPHSGILLRCTNKKLVGISLAHIGHLELDVNCERCRVRLASPHLKPNNRSFFSCPQCNHSLGLQFRPVAIHKSSDSLGYVDTLGCTIFGISRFSLIPTCTECLHSETLPEFDRILMNSNSQERCRQCHTRLAFLLPEVKCVKLAPTTILESDFVATDSATVLGPAAIKKVKIPSQVGSPLPDFGACPHYKKSNRWLRFPCCGKAFPCDKCHDKVSDHPQEFARSMICGYCSSEMPYSSNFPACRRCEHTLTSSTRGKSFWEGGKGTRDPKRMNRNDSKKYAGLNKTISRAKQNKS